MAILKSKDIRGMSKEELAKKKSELQRELLKSSTQKTMGMVPDNPGKIKELRRTIARINTITHQKEVEK